MPVLIFVNSWAKGAKMFTVAWQHHQHISLHYSTSSNSLAVTPQGTLRWGTAIWDAQIPFCCYFENFHEKIIKLFDLSSRRDEPASLLVRLSQGCHSITDFANQFQTLTTS